jgi:hypothetical protein
VIRLPTDVHSSGRQTFHVFLNLRTGRVVEMMLGLLMMLGSACLGLGQAAHASSPEVWSFVPITVNGEGVPEGGEIPARNQSFPEGVPAISADGRYLLTTGGPTNLLWRDRFTSRRIPIGYYPDGSLPDHPVEPEYLEGQSPYLGDAAEYSIYYDWTRSYRWDATTLRVTEQRRWSDRLASALPEFCGPLLPGAPERSTRNGVLLSISCPADPRVTGTRPNTYLWDPSTNKITLESLALDGSYFGSNYSIIGDMSDDNNLIVYQATVPVPGNFLLGQELILFNQTTGSRTRILPVPGGDFFVESPIAVRMSRDGSAIAITTDNNNAPVPEGELRGAFYYVTSTREYRRFPVPAGWPAGSTVQASAVAISPNGRWVVVVAADTSRCCPTPSYTMLYDAQTNTSVPIAATGSNPGFSQQGISAVWVGDGGDAIVGTSQALSSGDTNGRPDLYYAHLQPLDDTAPVTRDDASSDWQNTAATVHLTASDSGSGVANTYFRVDGQAIQTGTSVTVPAPLDHSDDGVHTIEYYSVDNAGNTETPSKAALVKIDTRPPSISCSAPEPIWNDQNVVIECAASDAESGLKDESDATFSLSTSIPAGVEDANAYTDQRRICDAAGSCADGGPIPGIKVDRKAPSTTDDAPSGWQHHQTTVHLTAQDLGSGVRLTKYALDEGTNFIDGSQIDVNAPLDHSNDGVHPISYYSVDNAGNLESSHLTLIAIDTTPPVIQVTRTPGPNANGWNSGDVIVTFACSDAGSGVASCPAAATLGEGANQSVSAPADDNAGNSSFATISGISVDKTPPTISGAATTSANSAGWYNDNVTIRWSCSDRLSGIAGSCPSDDVIAGEGTALTASASVADMAGNVAAATSSPVKLDRTSPVTTASAPSSWTNQGVTVPLSALDNLSGVAATYYQVDAGPVQTGTSVTVDEEGVHTLTFWSSDRAGNVEAKKSIVLMIDKTAPAITHGLDPAANTAGWNNTAVTVSFVCGDSLSGIAFCTPSQFLTSEGQAQAVHGQARDYAGNRADDTAFVSIDETPPTITADTDRAPNGYGWFNAPIKVSFSCSDVLSGVASCPSAVTLAEGANQSARGTSFDAAGNNQSTTLANIDIDMTAPRVTYSGNAGTYTVDQTVNITCASADVLSGVASSTCSDITGPAWSFGLGTTSRSASATDRAGNTGTGSTSFNVIVTSASFDDLIAQFFGGDQDGASGLIAKADSIGTAPNANARNGALGAFDNQVDAKIGNPLTPAQATLLKQLAASL